MNSLNPHSPHQKSPFWYRGRSCRCGWATAPSSLRLSDGGLETDPGHCLPFLMSCRRLLRPLAIGCSERMSPELRLGKPFHSALLSPGSGGQMQLHSPTEKRSVTTTDQGSCDGCWAGFVRPGFRLSTTEGRESGLGTRRAEEGFDGSIQYPSNSWAPLR